LTSFLKDFGFGSLVVGRVVLADLRPVGEEKVDRLHPVGEALHPDLD